MVDVSTNTFTPCNDFERRYFATANCFFFSFKKFQRLLFRSNRKLWISALQYIGYVHTSLQLFVTCLSFELKLYIVFNSFHPFFFSFALYFSILNNLREVFHTCAKPWNNKCFSLNHIEWIVKMLSPSLKSLLRCTHKRSVFSR